MRLRRLGTGLALLGFGVALAAYALLRAQGGDRDRLEELGLAKVHFDARDIPTVEAASWAALFEAQGYLHASERMFQMDLARRSAFGRLAEWFGPVAAAADRARHERCWPDYAKDLAARLSPSEREAILGYAKGVDRFVSERRFRHGLEYLLLGAEPEPWRIEDTLGVLLVMSEFLASSADDEALEAEWRAHLSPAWAAFLFSPDHPWNAPMFGEKPAPGPPLPLAEPLPARPLGADFLGSVEAAGSARWAALAPSRPSGFGSNNWAWCGDSGCFLANDPHLGQSVPQLWYAMRLRVSADDWALGVTLPGIPGVTLGMNPHLAWAFTNVGEDVEDDFAETVEGDTYRTRTATGGLVRRPIEVTRRTLVVRGAASELVECRRTERGPLHRLPGRDGWFSRRWLPFARLGFPVDLASVKSFEELNRALDAFPAPAQNVLMVDRRRNLGYRASGTTIDRNRSGRLPTDDPEAWRGLLPPSARPRRFIAAGPGPRFLATANERVFVDAFGHPFDGDERKARIVELLSSSPTLTRDDMARFQLDTHSRFHRLVLDVVRRHADPRTPAERAVLARWASFTSAEADPESYGEALAIADAIAGEALARIRAELLGGRPLAYRHSPPRAALIAMLESEVGVGILGIDPRELSSRLLAAAAAGTLGAPDVFGENRWRAQHPFAGLPVLGALFRVAEPPQRGGPILVRVETPTFGASVRLVYDLDEPLRSRWSFPVGQSGHVVSPHYDDLQLAWGRGEGFEMFDPSYEWRFAPGGLRPAPP